jgi:hypothetical protein
LGEATELWVGLERLRNVSPPHKNAGERDAYEIGLPKRGGQEKTVCNRVFLRGTIFSKELVAIPIGRCFVIKEKNSGRSLVGQGKFHGVPLPRFQIGSGVQELKLNESSLAMNRYGIYHGTIDGPDGPRDEEGVHRIGADGGYCWLEEA